MKITIRNLQKKIPIKRKTIRKAAREVFPPAAVNKAAEITVSLVSDNQIRKLNRDYLGKDCPTDVLAFDISGFAGEIIADIIVSTDTAMRNARIFETTPLYETYLYIIHGLLHLAGYNDKTAKQRRLMDTKAAGILTKITKLTKLTN